MSDVSAVVLTLGEPATQRAVESLTRQTLAPEEVIVIEHVTPFHRAIGEGARRVRTPFFVQVDADMILDASCIDVLRRHVRADSGMVVGALRDPLEGQAIGVKLLRAECFQRAAMPDSISPDTDFGEQLHRLGWHVHYVRDEDADSPSWPTLGEHRPDYTPSHTYRKMLLEGARLVHRPARHGLVHRMSNLDRSSHPLALLAQVALAHGLFLPLTRDELRPAALDPRAAWLTAFLETDTADDRLAADIFPIDDDQRLRDVYRRCLAAGRRLSASEAGTTFRQTFARLDSQSDWRQMVARVGLAHGALDERAGGTELNRDEQLLRRFVSLGLGSRARLGDELRARAVLARDGLRGKGGHIRW
jgi:hypothetical protein